MDSSLTRLATLVALTVLLGATSALAAGNPANGKSVFVRCAVCHKVASGGGNGIGPNLFGVAGRTAGSVAGFNYSPAMKAAGFAWTNDKLKAYVTNPQAVVPGDRMAFAGISNPTQADDLVAYLDTLK
jgi:cytochrome c